MSNEALSPRAFQAAVLVLLVVGIGFMVVQQRRIGELEAKIVAVSATVVSRPAPPPRVLVPASARRFEPVPGAAPGTVAMTNLTKEEAFEVAARFAPPPPPVASANVPAFLQEQRIGPALWKKVQAVNERASAELHALAKEFPSGTVEESEARLSKLDSERKAAVSKLLTAEQASAYEAMRTNGGADGVIVLADGAITRYVYRY